MILLARRKYPQGVRHIRRAAKLPTAVRFIPPCAKVFPSEKRLYAAFAAARVKGPVYFSFFHSATAISSQRLL